MRKNPIELPLFPEGETPDMATLYQDPCLTCDDEGLTIHRYYFPFSGDKHVPYAAIRQAWDRPMGPLTGQWRIWGMGLSPYWFHLDANRPSKTRCIVLDVGAVIRPVLTPDNLEVVLAILRDKVQVTVASAKKVA